MDCWGLCFVCLFVFLLRKSHFSSHFLSMSHQCDLGIAFVFWVMIITKSKVLVSSNFYFERGSSYKGLSGLELFRVDQSSLYKDMAGLKFYVAHTASRLL